MANSDDITISFHLCAYYLLPTERTLMNETTVSDFSLLHGYLSSESNFHYAVFAGLDSDNNPCWVMTYSELPDNAVIIPIECAENLLRVVVSQFKQGIYHG